MRNHTQPEAPSNHPDKFAYTPAEVASMTGFCRQTVIRLFENEKGVLVINRPETRSKRSYRTIRIPRNVYQRVINGISN